MGKGITYSTSGRDCPCCRTRYEVDYDDYKFCPNCGQAIDWSDEHDA